MKQAEIGFPYFQDEVRRKIGSLLDRATAFRAIGRDILAKRSQGQLNAVVREIGCSVANSFESSLILVSNGCANDAFRIARTMFESAVTIHYLDSHPDLVHDYVDFLWVKRKHHHEDLSKYAPEQAARVEAQQIRETDAEYQRIKHRFTNRNGRVRNSWCRSTVREMLEDIKADAMYGGMYAFTSSFMHTDMLGLVSASGDADGVISVPTIDNVAVALMMAVLSYAMTLTALNKIAGLEFGDRLTDAFARFKAFAELPVGEL